MDIAAYMAEVGQQARAAATGVARSTTAEALDAAREELALANGKDLQMGRENGLDAAMLDRLELTPQRIDTMIEGLRQVASLPDPIGAITDMNYRPSGIQVGKMRVPLGVIGIIYESRPNVTVESVPQVGQCDHSPGRLRVHSFQPGHCPLSFRGARESGTARECGAGDQDNGPRCGRRVDHHAGLR